MLDKGTILVGQKQIWSDISLLLLLLLLLLLFSPLTTYKNIARLPYLYSELKTSVRIIFIPEGLDKKKHSKTENITYREVTN